MACWAVGTGLYFRGEPDEADRWFAESAALAPASAQWLAGEASLAYRSSIAGERGRLEEQRVLAETAAEFVREHGTGKVIGVAPLALGVSLAARGRPGEALPLIERGVALSRTFGQPISWRMRCSARRRCFGPWASTSVPPMRQRRRDPSWTPAPIRASWPGGWLRWTGDRRPSVRSADQELTQRELRVLKLLDGDLSEREIGRELYVAHSTVHSHVRAIYRKLAVSTRAGALERGRQLGLL